MGLLPLAVAITDEWIAKNQFPVLADFETPFEIYRWVGGTAFDIDNGISYHGGSSLKIQLNTSKYSGVALKYFPALLMIGQGRLFLSLSNKSARILPQESPF
jgi:hypothetical protein